MDNFKYGVTSRYKCRAQNKLNFLLETQALHLHFYKVLYWCDDVPLLNCPLIFHIKM